MTATIFQIEQSLLNCVLAGLDNTGALSIDRVCIVPGEIAWDQCQCGQLVIAETQRFPSLSFPLEGADRTQECGSPYLVVQLTVSLTRCVPVMDQDGNPPDCGELSVAAQQLSKDMSAVRKAAECCLDTTWNDTSQGLVAYELGAQTVVGPEGGCAGSELVVFLGFANGCGCN